MQPGLLSKREDSSSALAGLTASPAAEPVHGSLLKLGEVSATPGLQADLQVFYGLSCHGGAREGPGAVPG